MSEDTGGKDATAQAVLDHESNGDGSHELATQPPMPPDTPADSDDAEILDLQTAVEKVLVKIRWHEEQIVERMEDIRGHEDQIEELRVSLRKHVAPLMNQPQRPRTERKTKTEPTVRKDADPATGSLIIEGLKKTRKPMDTKQIKVWLEERGNHTNPSVELSRMVKRGQLERANRGLYQLKK